MGFHAFEILELGGTDILYMKKQPKIKTGIAVSKLAVFLGRLLTNTGEVGNVGWFGPVIRVEHKPQLVVIAQLVLLPVLIQPLQDMLRRRMAVLRGQYFYMDSGASKVGIEIASGCKRVLGCDHKRANRGTLHPHGLVHEAS